MPKTAIVQFLNEYCAGAYVDFFKMKQDRVVWIDGLGADQHVNLTRRPRIEAFASSSSSAAPWDGEAPDELCCPITLKLFEDPVMTCWYKTYERAAIVDWFQTHDVDPITNMPAISKIVRDDYAMRAKCAAFRAGQRA